ncbi:MAG TPA: hypothetical protein VGK20_17780 [Candidatus Binatia bacterium]|jgi:hypothetical protein
MSGSRVAIAVAFVAGGALTLLVATQWTPSISAGAPPSPRHRRADDAVAAARTDAAAAHQDALAPQAQQAILRAIRRARTDAAGAMAAHKQLVVERCWKPSVASSPDPASMRLVYDVTFSPDGRQIARGIDEDRERARADVAKCAATLPLAMKIRPPGRSVRLQLVMDLP